MKKLNTLLVSLVTAGTLAVGGGIAYAAGAFTPGTSASTTTEPKAYGLCVHVKTKAVRALQVDNLGKSQYGACKQDGSELYMGVLGAGYVPPVTPLPAQVAYSAGGKHYVCTKTQAIKLRAQLPNGRYGRTVSPERYSCIEAVRPRNVPGPVPTVTPTPTVAPTTPGPSETPRPVETPTS